MAKYICPVCSYVYDEAEGIPSAGIAPGTRFEDLPDDWACPICGAAKDEFVRERVSPSAAPAAPEAPAGEGVHAEAAAKLDALEAAALCSNLAKGCEKQYLPREAELFRVLADWLTASAPAPENPAAGDVAALVARDLSEGIPAANAAAANDRGAKRALVWCEKVTRILRSLMSRYEKDGAPVPEGAFVYVCTICGFVMIGKEPPALCPVCKVPNWKFEKVEGGVA